MVQILCNQCLICVICVSTTYCKNVALWYLINLCSGLFPFADVGIQSELLPAGLWQAGEAVCQGGRLPTGNPGWDMALLRRDTPQVVSVKVSQVISNCVCVCVYTNARNLMQGFSPRCGKGASYPHPSDLSFVLMWSLKPQECFDLLTTLPPP